MAGLAVEDDHALHAGFDRLDAGLDLRDHAARNRAVLDESLGFGDREFLDQLLVLVEDARNVSEEEQARGIERTGNRTAKVSALIL